MKHFSEKQKRWIAFPPLPLLLLLFYHLRLFFLAKLKVPPISLFSLSSFSLTWVSPLTSRVLSGYLQIVEERGLLSNQSPISISNAQFYHFKIFFFVINKFLFSHSVQIFTFSSLELVPYLQFLIFLLLMVI